MTESEKRLLSIDLCGRLPYRVKVQCAGLSESMPQVWNLIGMPNAILCDIVVPNERRFSAVPIQDIKPYLRPLSSMTAEEFDEIKRRWVFTEDCRDENDLMDVINRGTIDTSDAYSFIDWLNVHHFDYRGLVEKGLALQAPEGMYIFM